jgi:MFS family permease
MTYFSTAAPTERRGAAMGAFSAALLGGMALGPMIGGVLADSWGWRAAVLSASVIGLMVAALGVGSSHERGLSGGAGGRVGPISAAAVAVSGRRSATVERLVLYAVAFASFFMFGAIPETLVPIIGADEHGLTASRIGFALGLGGACRLLGSVVGGRLADRISRKATLVPGLGLCALGVAILAVDGAGVGGWLTAIVLFSLGSYGIPVGATMLADQSAGTGVGRRLGTYRFVGDLGLIAGPALTALLYEHASVRVSVLVVTGLLTTVAVLSGLLLENAR